VNPPETGRGRIREQKWYEVKPISEGVAAPRGPRAPPFERHGMTDPLDLTGLQCPLVVLKIRRAMAAVPPGGTLTALADDPMALVDVPVMCHHMRFEMREAEQVDGIIHFAIEKPLGWTKPADRGPIK
jgi:tRNA 2-thiouridine synthesizing protein A